MNLELLSAQLIGVIFAQRCVSSLIFLIYQVRKKDYPRLDTVHLIAFLIGIFLRATGESDSFYLTERFGSLSFWKLQEQLFTVGIPQLFLFGFDYYCTKRGWRLDLQHKIFGSMGFVILLLIFCVFIFFGIMEFSENPEESTG
jgi:hypothetical protein